MRKLENDGRMVGWWDGGMTKHGDGRYCGNRKITDCMVLKLLGLFLSCNLLTLPYLPGVE